MSLFKGGKDFNLWRKKRQGNS